MRFAPLLLVLACGSGEVQIDSLDVGCENFDPDSPPAESIEVVQDGTSIVVSHVGVYAACSASFDPDFAIEGREIEVREFWVGAEDGDDCTSCRSPQVLIEAEDNGHYDLMWYLEDDSIPLDTVSFEIDG